MRKVINSEAQRTASDGFSLPAPIGGWNARDSLAMMPPTDAIYLDNLYPSTTSVDIRKGKLLYATLGVGLEVKSLLNCAKQDGTSKRFAVAEDGVYDVTAGGTIGAAEHVLTNAKVESVNINVAGINYLWCCNGVDKSFVYKSDSDTFIDLDGASTPVLTGITSTDVSNVHLWQNRIILCKKNSLAFYYMPLNSVGGAATAFDLGQIFTLGGYLVATADWSIDAGNGPQNRFVAITSEGEVAIYSGTDPSSATAFLLVGVYQLGRPLGKRCVLDLPGDIAVLTESGIWPLTKVMATATLDRRAALSDKIQKAYNSYAQTYGMDFGWQPILHGKASALLINVPITESISYQFVMNLLNKSWCRFTNWSATCFMVSEGELYYAMGNRVFTAWTGKTDNAASIVGLVKQAFTYGPSRQRSKHIKLVRPILTAEDSITVQMGLDTDFENAQTISSSTNFSQTISIWDQAVFDSAYWSAGSLTIKNWKTVAHSPGKAFSFRMRLSVRGIEVTWPATDFIMEPGSLFG